MKLGGSIVGPWQSIRQWEEMLIASRFKAISAPFNCFTPREEADEYCEIAAGHGISIAEVGVWKNLLDPDAHKAQENIAYAKAQLRLAEERNVPCCVNIVGTFSKAGWDAADKSNYAEETYDRIVSITRDIIDSVQPKRAFYCIEPMPWMVPDGPDEYLKLIRDVDRPQFAAHMDFVNMINCPRRYLGAEKFIEECFAKLAPYIKSTHIKDTYMPPTELTTVIRECAPGEGGLDFDRVLGIIDRYLPKDAPVLMEHMRTNERYKDAYDYLARKAGSAGIGIG
jgi:Sugar phosphate isomerases/epimerases